MASIRTRELTKGGASHTVRWRDPDAGLQSRTFSDRDKAQELKDFLDANGDSFKVAARAKVRKDSTAPTVSEVVGRHIDLLRMPQPGTIAKYRRMAAGHIDGSDLGRTPVDKVTKAAVLDWLDQLTVSKGANQTVDQPLSRKTKQNIHALLSAAFVTAMDAATMTRNPVKGVAEADLNEAREAVYLSPEDLVMLADRIDPHYSLFIRFLGGTDLRYSEATALRRRDVTIRDGAPQCASAGHGSRRARAKRSDRRRRRRPTAPSPATPRSPPPWRSTCSSSGSTTSYSSAPTATTSARSWGARRQGARPQAMDSRDPARAHNPPARRWRPCPCGAGSART